MTRTPVYTTRLDTVSSELMYVGRAAVGSSESSAVWQIKEIDLTGGDVIVKYAGGAGAFNYNWDDRASYVYS